jgi:hypothetical protein
MHLLHNRNQITHIVTFLPQHVFFFNTSLLQYVFSFLDVSFLFQQQNDTLIVTSHILGMRMGCAYMYIRTLLDTTRFKAVMVMNLSELCS